MFLFLFDLVVGLLYFDVQSLIVDIDSLKTHSNITVPSLGEYSNDPGVDRLVKGDGNLLVLAVAGLIGSVPVDGLKRLSVEGGVNLNDCHPITIIGISLEDEFGPEAGGL